MADPIERYLEVNGPALTSDVAAHLMESVGMKADAARKRVSRASGEIRRLAGLTFPHKARFLYLQQQFGSPLYWSKLSHALVTTRSAYGYAIGALHQRDGIVPERHFPIVCGAPVRQQKHLSPETIVSRLQQAGLVTRISVSGVGDCIALVQSEGHYETRAESIRARVLTEDMLLLAVKDWLKNLGVASYGKVATRGDEVIPKVGTFVWDLSGPSYLGALVRPKPDGGVRNGFVVCDAYLGAPMTLTGVAPFIRKCVTLRGLRNVGPTLQILVADRFERPAFQLLKHHGIIPATPSNLFGEEVASALRQLTSVLENAAHSIINAERFDELFRKLGQIEGASIQLRGTLFEYLAADLARKALTPDVKMNWRFKASGKGEAEADIVAVENYRSITVVECKGYSPRATIPDGLFKRWLEHSVPVTFAAIREHPDWRNLDPTFEFWTTAPLSTESMALFEKANASIRPSRYKINLKGPDDLHQMCLATRDANLISAFEKHFMKVERAPREMNPWYATDVDW